MKKFIISEDERSRILSMHESATKRQYLKEQQGPEKITEPTGTIGVQNLSPYRGFTQEQKDIFDNVYAVWNKGGLPAYYDANKNVAYYYPGGKKKGQDDNFEGVQYGVNMVRANRPSIAADGSVTYPYFWPTAVIRGSESGRPDIDSTGWDIKDAKKVKEFDDVLLGYYSEFMSEDIIKQLLLKSLDKVTNENQKQQIVDAIKNNEFIGPKYKSLFA